MKYDLPLLTIFLTIVAQLSVLILSKIFVAHTLNSTIEQYAYKCYTMFFSKCQLGTKRCKQ